MEMTPLALIFIAPASPSPRVLVLATAPSDKKRLVVSIVMSPAVPFAPGFTWLMMPLGSKPWLSSPLREMTPLALIFIAPASPSSKVLVVITAPSEIKRLLVSIIIPAEFTDALSPILCTWLEILLPPRLFSPVRDMLSLAISLINPELPRPTVFALRKVPFIRKMELAVIVILPLELFDSFWLTLGLIIPLFMIEISP